MTVAMSDASSAKFGSGNSGSKSSFEFTEEEKLIGLSGQLINNRLSKIGVHTYNP